MSAVMFTSDRRTVRTSDCAPNIYAFCVWMSAAVASRRGGKNSEYLRECADFMAEVVGKRLHVTNELPTDFDWTAAGAVEAAEALMEYDA